MHGVSATGNANFNKKINSETVIKKFAREFMIRIAPRWSSRLSWRWFIVLPLFLLLSFLAHAQSTGGYTVQINGAGTLTPVLNEYLEITRHTADADLSVEELQRLVAITPQQIRELLATEGYFSPAIDHTLSQEDGRWIARFNVVPGTPTVVSGVDIRFDGEITKNPAHAQRIDMLRRQWSLRPGERFRQAAWNNAKNTLLKGLLNRDYPAARIAASEARIDPDKHVAELTVDVDSGPAFTFGELNIQGLTRYSRAMIDMLNPIQPGEPFSQEKLTELQSRLQDTGYFRSVFATVEVDPVHPQHVPIRLDLTENERKRLAFGIGFSTDTGARGQLKWLDRNFLGRNWRLESELRVDRETSLLGADVFLPAIRSGWLPSVGAHYEHSNIAGETDDKIRTGARLTSPVKTDEQVWSVSYLADRQKIADIPANNRQALIASYSYTMRRLDNLLMPHDGYVASIELSAGPRGPLNETDLGRVVGNATWLSAMGRRWHTVLRGQVGQVFVAGRESVPADLLFRTGGNQTVRGYAFNSLGVAQNGAIVGGTVLAVLSAELVYAITPQWGAAVFTDAGNAADSWRGFRLQQGSGIGARWQSPVGPVNIDLAYGHETRKLRLHFSVGYGF
jgi:translocation and assembly module TamA